MSEVKEIVVCVPVVGDLASLENHSCQVVKETKTQITLSVMGKHMRFLKRTGFLFGGSKDWLEMKKEPFIPYIEVQSQRWV